MSKSVRPVGFVVLAAIDSIDSENVVRVAARFAAQVSGGELNLVHVIRAPPGGRPSTTAALDEGRHRLENVGRAAVDVYTATIIGTSRLAIPRARFSRSRRTSRQTSSWSGPTVARGSIRLVLGSVAEHIVLARRAPCSSSATRTTSCATNPRPRSSRRAPTASRGEGEQRHENAGRAPLAAAPPRSCDVRDPGVVRAGLVQSTAGVTEPRRRARPLRARPRGATPRSARRRDASREGSSRRSS